MEYSARPDEVEASVAGLTNAYLGLIAYHIVDAYDTTWHCIEAAIGKPGRLYTLDWYDADNR